MNICAGVVNIKLKRVSFTFSETNVLAIIPCLFGELSQWIGAKS